jgi:hypothetical protein
MEEQMNKSELQENDLLVFKNNHKAFLTQDRYKIIQEYYDDELNCLTKDNYTIIQVYRPEYRLVFDKSDIKGHIKTKTKE